MAATKVTVLIVEDDPIIAKDLSYHLQDLGYSPFPPVRSVEDALLLLNNVTPDLVLIDVSLEGEEDGIDLAEKINQQHDLPIIFLTALHDRATIDRIKATRPSAYLVKPLQVHNLQTSIELALYNQAHQSLTEEPIAERTEDFVTGSHFFIKVKQQLRKVLLEEVEVLEAFDNYAFLHTADQKHIISSSLKDLERKLIDQPFVRIHRSYMVNLGAIERIEEDIVVIRDFRIPIGKTYKEEFMKRIQLL
jgi:DNA-binding LytR/AlgR family response regulator